MSLEICLLQSLIAFALGFLGFLFVRSSTKDPAHQRMSGLCENGLFYTEEIERGAALLDKNCPGWEQRVDLEKLSIRSAYDDILGQCYGHYVRGLHTLGFALADAPSRPRSGLNHPASHGFTDGKFCLKYDQLTIEWREFIENRLAEAA